MPLERPTGSASLTVGGCVGVGASGSSARGRVCVAQPRPHHHDRVLGMVGIEPQHDRLGERRVAGVVLHDRDLFVARGLERVAKPEQPGREHRADRGAAELVDRPVRHRARGRRRPPAATSARPCTTRVALDRDARDDARAATGTPVTVQPSGSTGTSRSGTRDARADGLEVGLLRGPLLEERAELRRRAARRASRRAPPGRARGRRARRDGRAGARPRCRCRRARRSRRRPPRAPPSARG